LASKINLLNADHKQEQNEHKDLQENMISNKDLLRSPLKKKSCIKELETNHDLQTLNENNLTNNEKCLDFSKPSTSRTLPEEVARNCNDNLLISPKISDDSLKASYLKIHSLSEGTNGANLHGQTNQNNCSKIHQPVHNLETKQVMYCGCNIVQQCVVPERFHIPGGWRGVSKLKYLRKCMKLTLIGISREVGGLRLRVNPNPNLFGEGGTCMDNLWNYTLIAQ